MFLFQLRAALFDIHDIFFTMTLEERLSLLQQDRDLRSERKLREMVTINTFGFIFIGLFFNLRRFCLVLILGNYFLLF